MKLEKEIKILFNYETPIEDILLELQDIFNKYGKIKVSEGGYICLRTKEQ